MQTHELGGRQRERADDQPHLRSSDDQHLVGVAVDGPHRAQVVGDRLTQRRVPGRVAIPKECSRMGDGMVPEQPREDPAREPIEGRHADREEPGRVLGRRAIVDRRTW